MSPKTTLRSTLARPTIAAALLACLPAAALAEGDTAVEVTGGGDGFGSLDATAGAIDVGWSDDKAAADRYYLRVPLPEKMKTDAMGEGLRTFEEAARASQFDALDGNPAAAIRQGPAKRVPGGRSGKSIRLMLPTGTLFDGRALTRIGGMRVNATTERGLGFFIDGNESKFAWTGLVSLIDVSTTSDDLGGVSLLSNRYLAIQLSPASLAGSPALRADCESANGLRTVILLLPTVDGRVVSLSIVGKETPPPDLLVSELASSVRLSRNTQASATPSFADYEEALEKARATRRPHIPESVASSLGFVAVQPADPDQRLRAGLGGDPATKATAYLMADGSVAVVGVGATGIDERSFAQMLQTGPVPPYTSGSLGGYPAISMLLPALNEGAQPATNLYVPVTGGLAVFLSIQGPASEDEAVSARIANAVVVPEWLFSGLDEAAIQRSLRNQFSAAKAQRTVVAADGSVSYESVPAGEPSPVVEPGQALQVGLWGTGVYASYQGASLMDQQLSLGLRIGGFGSGDGGFGLFLPVHYRSLTSLGGEGESRVYSEVSGGAELFLGAPGPGLGFSAKAALYFPIPGVGGHGVLGAFLLWYPFNGSNSPTGVGLTLGYQFALPGSQ